MPAGYETLALPHTFRPLGVRLAAYVFGSLLVVIAVVIWFAFPPEVRDQFTAFQLATVVVLGLGAAACGFALARCRLVARERSLTVVNGYKARTYEWSQVVAVSLRQGSPWVTLDLSDGSTVSAMGIQGSDGVRAIRQVKALRALVEQKTRTERND